MYTIHDDCDLDEIREREEPSYRHADWWKSADEIRPLKLYSDEEDTLAFRLASVVLEFNERADRVESNISAHSSPSEVYLNRDYIAIMGMGMREPETIVPLILKRVPSMHADWFFALETIAGKNHSKDCENFEDALKAWREWSEKRFGVLDALRAA
jgi:hypothetical protein